MKSKRIWNFPTLLKKFNTNNIKIQISFPLITNCKHKTRIFLKRKIAHISASLK